MNFILASIILSLPFLSAAFIENSPNLIRDEILDSNIKTDISSYYSSTAGQEILKVHGPKIFLKTISKGNLVAFQVLMEQKADPFKIDGEYKLSAWDFLKTIPNPSANQSKMLEIIESLPSSANRRTDPIVLASLAGYARFCNFEALGKLTKSKNFPLNVLLQDGSKFFHQAVIGNNKELMRALILSEIGSIINEEWQDRGSKIDIQNYSGINPIGWSPLMLAVALNRYEMVEIMKQSPHLQITSKSRMLARFLPERMRFPMLKLCATDIEKKGPNYFENLKLEDVEFAVEHLNPENMKVVFEESAFLTSKACPVNINQKLWDSLKKDKKSNQNELSTKISYLKAFGFDLFDRNKFEKNLLPWHEILTSTTPLRSELESAVTELMPVEFINSIEAIDEPPIILALRYKKSNIVKLLLKNYERNGLQIDYVNEFKENLMHLAISWMEDESNLEEIIELLLEIEPVFLNAKSGTSSKNSHSYKLNDDKTISYSTTKRSNWTPLMYAVMLRKDRTAKFLQEKKGADILLTGLDGINAKEIIGLRCEEYKKATTIVLPPTVDRVKKKFNEEAKDRIIKTIIANNSKKYSYQ